MKSSKRISLIIILGVIISIMLIMLAFGERNNVFKLRDKIKTNMKAEDTTVTYDLSATEAVLMMAVL